MKTSGDSNPELIFEGFKAGGSYLKKPSLASPTTKPVDGDQEVRDSVREIEKRSVSSRDKNDDKNYEKQPQFCQTQVQWPLLENSNGHSSSEGNSSCSMEIETLEIPKGLLQRIDHSL